jgi:hypothetical protein
MYYSLPLNEALARMSPAVASMHMLVEGCAWMVKASLCDGKIVRSGIFFSNLSPAEAAIEVTPWIIQRHKTLYPQKAA